MDEESFFYRIYPSISQRLNDLERDIRHLNFAGQGLRLENMRLMEIVLQYKRKIQNVEQFLLNQGLLDVLKSNKEKE